MSVWQQYYDNSYQVQGASQACVLENSFPSRGSGCPEDKKFMKHMIKTESRSVREIVDSGRSGGVLKATTRAPAVIN